MLLVFGVVLAVGLAYGALIVPEYEASATLLLQDRQVPESFVRSATSTYADRLVQIISERVLNTRNLLELARRYDLIEGLTATDVANRPVALAAGVRKRIALRPITAQALDRRSGRETKSAIAFRISFTHKDPDSALAVVEELAELFLEEHSVWQTGAAQQGAKLVAGQAQVLVVRIKEIETELFEFRREYSNRLPRVVPVIRQASEQATRELDDTRARIQSLEKQKSFLRAELAKLQPHALIYNSDGNRILTPLDRIRMLEAEYAEKSARYAPEHPDLVRVKAEIGSLNEVVAPRMQDFAAAQLKALDSELASKHERYARDHPDVKDLENRIRYLRTQLAMHPAKRPDTDPIKPDNPAYISARADLEAADIELQTRKVRESELIASIIDYEGRLLKAPEIEQMLGALERRYDTVLQEYKAVKERQLEADLAESLEKAEQGERLVLLERPFLPEKPSNASAPRIVAVLSFLMAVAGALAGGLLRDRFDLTIHDGRDATQLLGEPPITIVPRIT